MSVYSTLALANGQ